jgi:hypothetical protein
MVRRTEGQLSFAVYRGGELGGLVWFELGNGVSAVVHVIFKPEFWGSATTMPALTQAADRYFETGHKLNSVFFPSNKAVRSVVKKFGFRYEGRVRDATLRNGELADLELWGLKREEFYGNRNGDLRSIGGSGSADGRAGEQKEDDHQHAVDNPAVIPGVGSSAECGIGQPDAANAQPAGNP